MEINNACTNWSVISLIAFDIQLGFMMERFNNLRSGVIFRPSVCIYGSMYVDSKIVNKTCVGVLINYIY